jgi:DMSO/TMAO reductase YedYZ molybdopterin-dependent catalytic subunit
VTDRKQRIPPGQTETKKWPVLHYGEVPRYAPGQWDFRCFGLVDAERRWSLAELKALPQSESTRDIHCVTTWSRLDTTFRGVRVRDLCASVGRRPEAQYVPSTPTLATRSTSRSRTCSATTCCSRPTRAASR